MALIVTFGTVAALVRRYVNFQLGIPGHSGVAWMAVLVLGYLLTRRFGAGIGMGVTSALASQAFGFGNSTAFSFAVFGSVGAALDLVYAIPFIRRESLFGGALAGAVAHLTKFGVGKAIALAVGGLKNVAFVGLGVATLNHILFGVVGGLIAVMIFTKARSIARDRRPRA